MFLRNKSRRNYGWADNREIISSDFSSDTKARAKKTHDVNIKLSPWLTDAQLLQKYNYRTKKEKQNTIEALESFVLISKSCLLQRNPVKSFKVGVFVIVSFRVF